VVVFHSFSPVGDFGSALIKTAGMTSRAFNGHFRYIALLGGELPTARFCGLVHPSDKNMG